MSRFLCLFFGLLLSAAAPLHAQKLEYRQGELIVQFGADVDAKKWITARKELTSVQVLSRTLNLYLLQFDHARYAERQLRRTYWSAPEVELVQLNHLLTHRRRPNDPRYDQQWQHRNLGQLNGVVGADHNIEAAWDVTTGGQTANGDDIVVAILDSGTDLDHEDLAGNHWINTDEIPGNEIDDDNNGYIDDYNGFNTVADNGNVEAGNDGHGVSVTGIIGAVGNNNTGVSGMNWSVGLMTIKNNFRNSEAEVLQAYSYALDARMEYELSQGQRGAYVVATNASWGLDLGRPEDSPIWCSLYDELGDAGILSMGAVINGDINVEEEGDLPTNCPSDYLIGVTNINTFDNKVRAAGFGAVSVDLGAYGEDAFTTARDNSYGFFSGTSSATPHVTGAAALLYSAPCETFAQLLSADPAAAALYVKDILLSTVRPNDDLSGITVTGGRLDVGAAMAEMMSRCDDCLAPTSFRATPVEGSATEIVVDWKSIDRLDNVNLRYRLIGVTEWTEITNASAPYTLDSLPACTGYEFQLTGNCGGTTVSTAIEQVATDGCCIIPPDFSVTAADNQQFFVRWSPLLAARRYRIRYRQLGDDNWRTRTSTLSQLGIAGDIEPCTSYEFQFQTDCDTLLTEFGNTITLVSTGCGSCQEANYCVPAGYDNSREWIAEVNIGNVLVKRSGAAAGGYRHYGEVNQRSYVRGGVYPVRLSPGFPNIDDIEEFRVYVDWDQNGFFSGDELELEIKNDNEDGVAEGLLEVPEDAELLLTRMRVIMQFRQAGGTPCSDNRDGEVEDYCLNIAAAEGCPPPKDLTADYDDEEDLTFLDWRASAATGNTYSLRYRLQNSSDEWIETTVEGITAAIPDLNLCGTYEVELASICAGTTGEYRHFYFNDECTSTPERRLDTGVWSVFPNPAAGETSVRWDYGLRMHSLRLFSVDGRLLRELRPGRGQQLDLELSGLAQGIYLLELRTDDGKRGLRRLVVQ